MRGCDLGDAILTGGEGTVATPATCGAPTGRVSPRLASSPEACDLRGAVAVPVEQFIDNDAGNIYDIGDATGTERLRAHRSAVAFLRTVHSEYVATAGRSIGRYFSTKTRMTLGDNAVTMSLDRCDLTGTSWPRAAVANYELVTTDETFYASSGAEQTRIGDALRQDHEGPCGGCVRRGHPRTAAPGPAGVRRRRGGSAGRCPRQSDSPRGRGRDDRRGIEIPGSPRGSPSLRARRRTIDVNRNPAATTAPSICTAVPGQAGMYLECLADVAAAVATGVPDLTMFVTGSSRDVCADPVPLGSFDLRSLEAGFLGRIMDNHPSADPIFQIDAATVFDSSRQTTRPTMTHQRSPAADVAAQLHPTPGTDLRLTVLPDRTAWSSTSCRRRRDREQRNLPSQQCRRATDRRRRGDGDRPIHPAPGLRGHELPRRRCHRRCAAGDWSGVDHHGGAGCDGLLAATPASGQSAYTSTTDPVTDLETEGRTRARTRPDLAGARRRGRDGHRRRHRRPASRGFAAASEHGRSPASSAVARAARRRAAPRGTGRRIVAVELEERTIGSPGFEVFLGMGGGSTSPARVWSLGAGERTWAVRRAA